MVIDACRLAKTELAKWVVSPRMILWLPITIYIDRLVIEPIIKAGSDASAAANNSYTPSFFEGFIALGTSGALILTLPIVFLVLLSDYPSMDSGFLLLVHRVGRKGWILGEILFLGIASIIYIGSVALICVVLMIGRSDISFSWSRLIVEYGEVFPDRYGDYFTKLIPKNLYNQMSPIEAVAHTYLLLFMYLCLLGGIMLFARILHREHAGLFLAVLVITLGAVFCTFHSEPMWVFPMSHSIVWVHYTEYFRKPEVPLWSSYVYMIVGILLVLILSYRIGKRCVFYETK